MNNIIKNILIMIEEGKSNEEIIKTRIKYFKSDEYKNKRLKDIREPEKIFGTNISLDDSNNVVFKDGFIDDDYVISHISGRIDWCGGYTIDYNVLNYLLDYIRINLDYIKHQNEISIKSLISITQKFFDAGDDSKYKNVINILKEFYSTYEDSIDKDNVQLFIRYELPEIICSYNSANFEGAIEDYTYLFLNSWINEDVNNEFKKIEFDETKLFSTLKLSDLQNSYAAACTEYSMLMQNYLCFLGYDSFLIGGKVNGGGHNYNIIRENNQYKIIDVGQMVYDTIPNIKEPYQLLTFGEYETMTYSKAYARRHKDSKMLYESEYNEENKPKTM